MFERTQAIGRIVVACLALAALVSSETRTEQLLLCGLLPLIVVTSRLVNRERYEVLSAAALGVALPTLPWLGSHMLLAPVLLFFALRRPTRSSSVGNVEWLVPLWIAPLLGYLLGSVIGEFLQAVGMPGIESGGVISQVRVDGALRVIDLARSLLDVHIPSWAICARLVLAGLCISFFSSQRDALAAFVRWLSNGCALSAVYVILQWLGLMPLKLPNQTALWDALGRPSGLATDPNALGVVLALALWVQWLQSLSGAGGSQRSWWWRVLVVAAGVVSGSRTFLVAVGLLVPVAALQRGRSRLVWCALGCALCLVVGISLVDAYSGLVELVVAREGLPMGLRRGLAALSLLRLEETFMSRGVFIQFAQEIGRGHWLFGVGGDRFIEYVPRVGAELNLVRGWRDNSNNFYLGILVELGCVGIVTCIMALFGLRLRRDGSWVGAVGCLSMLGVIACTGPHTDFAEVAILVGVLVAMTTEMRRISPAYFVGIASTMGVLGVVATTYRESGVYGWNNTSEGAARWLSHSAKIEALCAEHTDQGSQARISLKPRYIPQMEPLRLAVTAGAQPGREVLLRTPEVYDVLVPCASNERSTFVHVQTHPAWSPYRAWPRVSNDRRILGVEQVFGPTPTEPAQ